MQKRLLSIIPVCIVLITTALSQASSFENTYNEQFISKYYSQSDTDIYTNNKLKSLTDYVKSIQALPSEKIYVHTDRTGYLQGDTIWFKAYSWCGYEQVADTISKVLYAELINARGRSIISKKLLINNGISAGDFTLDTTVVPGRYFIRAYTQWMKNLQPANHLSGRSQ